jgi:16S rRNA processing protein RimM
MPDRITLAAVAGAHGIGGEVRLKLFAQGVDSLARHKDVVIGDQAFALTSVRAGGQGAIARLTGVSSREAAEALRGRLVTVPRDALPPLVEGEFYYADLIGLPCTDLDGVHLGRVLNVENFGAGDLLEIERESGGTTLVPFRAPAAELNGDRVVVDPVFLA